MVRSDAAPMNSRPPRIARGGWLDALRFIVGALIILYHFREAARLRREVQLARRQP